MVVGQYGEWITRLVNKIHIFMDEFSVIKNKKNVSYNDFVLYSKGLSNCIDFCNNKYELKGFSNSKNIISFSKLFKLEFEKFGARKHSFIIDSQVNDVFKFIFLELLEICELLGAKDDKQVFLYGGHEKIKFVSVFLASNTEVANPILSNRARILNPFLAGWLDSNSNFRVSWKQESYFKLKCIKFMRNIAIYFISLFLVIKSIRFSTSEIKTNKKNVVVYRTDDQYENLKLLEKYYADNILFVKGPAITKSKVGHNIVTVTVALKSFFISIRSYLENIFTSSTKIELEFLGGIFTLKNSEVVDEASLVITSYAHYYGLIDCLDEEVHFLFSSELTSRYAILEKLAVDAIGGKCRTVGIQFISVGNLIVPLIPVQNMFITKSKNDEQYILSLNKNRDVKCLGSFSMTNFFKGEEVYERTSCKNIVFFTQPYGIEDNKKIITSILNVLPNDWSCIIRKHPRDNTKYELLSEVIKIDGNPHYLKTLVEADVVITKTSSILSECFDFDKKHAAIVIDNYSKSVIDSIAGNEVNKLDSLDGLEFFLIEQTSNYKYIQEVYAPRNLIVTKSLIESFLTK